MVDVAGGTWYCACIVRGLWMTNSEVDICQWANKPFLVCSEQAES